MQTCNFYRREEIQDARKEKRQSVSSFGITSDAGTIKQLINKCGLHDDYVWDTI
jgi:hypothetical protein